MLAFLVGCASTKDVTIDLTDSDGNCAAAFANVNAISIEVIAKNGQCRLAHECASTAIAPKSLEAAEQALHDTADVLLELSADDAQELVINGRPQKSCFPSTVESNHPVLCGYAPISAAKDGRLVVELEPETGNVCPESIPLCP